MELESGLLNLQMAELTGSTGKHVIFHLLTLAYVDNNEADNKSFTLQTVTNGMLFRTFEGKLIMSVHSHKKVNGRTTRIPQLFEVDDSGDKIVLGNPY